MTFTRSPLLLFVVASAVAVGCAAPVPREPGVDEADVEAQAAPEPRPAIEEPVATASAPPSAPDAYECEGCEEVSEGASIYESEIVEGDILLAAPSGAEPSIAGSTTAVELWPRGIVPYVVDASVTKRERITEAVAHWRDLVGIRLVPRTTQTDYVRFIRRDGCSSFIGRQGGRQDINLADNCSAGSTIHEVGHAIGLYHEQSRSDRDRYVTVNLDNVAPDKRGNYRATTFTSIGEYDLTSLMHYGTYYFSSNRKPVMTTKDGKPINANRASLSPKDVIGVRRLYQAESLPQPAADAGVATVQANAVLRESPTALDKHLATVAEGAQVQRLGTRSGNYTFVAHGGKRGWVYGPFLDKL